MKNTLENCGPIISVDRLVGQYYDRVDVDPDKINDFYDSLPYDDKPPLEICHIHLSGIAPRLSGFQYVAGMVARNHKEAKLYDPQAPKDMNIAIFTGFTGLAPKSDPDSDPNVTLGHELIHYAARHHELPPQLIPFEDRVLQKELSLYQSRKLKAARFIGGSAVWAVALWGFNELLNQHPPSYTYLIYGPVIKTALTIAKRRRKNKQKINGEEFPDREKEIMDKLQDNYEESPVEQEVEGAAQSLESAIRLVEKTEVPIVIVRDIGTKNHINDRIRRQASLGSYMVPIKPKKKSEKG